MQLPFVNGFFPGVGLYPAQQRPLDFILGFILGFVFGFMRGLGLDLGFFTLGIYEKESCDLYFTKFSRVLHRSTLLCPLFVFFLVSLWIQFALINKKLEIVKDKNKSHFERRWNEIDQRYK